jgi:hypothetical protein
MSLELSTMSQELRAMQMAQRTESEEPEPHYAIIKTASERGDMDVTSRI